MALVAVIDHIMIIAAEAKTLIVFQTTTKERLQITIPATAAAAIITGNVKDNTAQQLPTVVTAAVKK